MKASQNEKCVVTGNEELLELSRELQSACVTRDIASRKKTLV